MAKGGVFFAGMPPWAGLPGGQGGASRRAGGKPVALIYKISATDFIPGSGLAPVRQARREGLVRKKLKKSPESLFF